MPIVEVEVVGDKKLKDGLAREIADAAGVIFEGQAGGTWVRLRRLPEGQYAENGGGPPEGVWPVFVNVLKGGADGEDERREEAGKLAEAIGALCGRPVDNVHILYLPSGAGRIFFGGTRGK